MLWDGKNNLEVFHQLKKYDKEQRIANQVNKEIINTRRNAAKIQSIGLTLAFNAVANQIKTPKTKRARKL